MCILNQHKCKDASLHRVQEKKKNYKQKYCHLMRQTANYLSYQDLSMLNEKTYYHTVGTFHGLYIDKLPPQDWQVLLYKSKYTGFYSW